MWTLWRKKFCRIFVWGQRTTFLRRSLKTLIGFLKFKTSETFWLKFRTVFWKFFFVDRKKYSFLFSKIKFKFPAALGWKLDKATSWDSLFRLAPICYKFAVDCVNAEIGICPSLRPQQKCNCLSQVAADCANQRLGMNICSVQMSQLGLLYLF